MNQDQQHIKLLSIFYYVLGGLVAIFACFPIIHLCIGIAMLNGTIDDAPAFVGLMFIIIPLFMIILGWVFAICLILAGKNLARHKKYTFCLVIAAISCAFFPFGTTLGVFTIIVLMRPSVKELFEANKWDSNTGYNTSYL